MLLIKYLGRITDNKDLVTKEYVDNSLSGAGDVSGPASSVDGNIAVFNGTSGKVIADSGANIDEFVLAEDVVDTSSATPINADTLNGHADSYFATASDLAITNAALANIKEVFVATYGTTTYAEINEAYTAGKFIIVVRSGLNGTTVYTLADINTSNTFYFRSFSNANATNYGCYITSSGTWSANSYTYATLASPTFTGTPKTSANTSYTIAQLRNITLSTSAPSGGSNGDVWIVYTA